MTLVIALLLMALLAAVLTALVLLLHRLLLPRPRDLRLAQFARLLRAKPSGEDPVSIGRHLPGGPLGSDGELTQLCVDILQTESFHVEFRTFCASLIARCEQGGPFDRYVAERILSSPRTPAVVVASTVQTALTHKVSLDRRVLLDAYERTRDEPSAQGAIRQALGTANQ